MHKASFPTFPHLLSLWSPFDFEEEEGKKKVMGAQSNKMHILILKIRCN
jgi:hypothetical protein